jgi:hypothetical protein
MFREQDFDRSFRRIKRFSIVFVVVRIIFGLAIVVAIGYFGTRLIKNIATNGLKPTIERIWEGPVQ